MRRGLAVGMVVAGSVVLGGCGETPQVETADMDAERAQVWFSEPQDGAVVTGPDLRVVMETSNLRIVEAGVFEEGTGHHHVFVNEDVTPMGDVIPANIPGVIHLGDGSHELVLTDLEPGEHRLIAVVADGAHISLDPPVQDTIFITVVEPDGEG